MTGAGGRLLAARLAAPLARAEPIRRRLDAVQALVDDPALRADLREALKGCPDLERALSRLSLGRGGPRDLLAIRTGLAAAGEIKAAPGAAALRRSPAAARRSTRRPSSVARLEAALVPDPPFLARDGGFIAAGFQVELDRLRALRDQARRHIAALEARIQRETGIGSLKIRHNNLLGYYIEVTATHRAKVPAHFVQRQSMANATRYSIAELAELESQIASAARARADARARAVRGALPGGARRGRRDRPDRAGDRAARRRGGPRRARGRAALLSAPRSTTSDAFAIRAGRHPVVEQALAARGQALHRQRCGPVRQRSACGC